MKNLIKAGLVACIFSLVSVAANAQRVYVNIRPSRPVVVVKRPVAPSSAHIWVDEEWAPQGRTYAWKGGYWAAPPRPRAVYVPGHWVRAKKGHVWISGHWR
jgi:hypothetical protein